MKGEAFVKTLWNKMRIQRYLKKKPKKKVGEDTKIARRSWREMRAERDTSGKIKYTLQDIRAQKQLEQKTAWRLRQTTD